MILSRRRRREREAFRARVREDRRLREKIEQKLKALEAEVDWARFRSRGSA